MDTSARARALVSPIEPTAPERRAPSAYGAALSCCGRHEPVVEDSVALAVDDGRARGEAGKSVQNRIAACSRANPNSRETASDLRFCRFPNRGPAREIRSNVSDDARPCAPELGARVLHGCMPSA